MKRTLAIFSILLILGMLLTACGAKEGKSDELETVPAAYAGKTNPFANDAAAITAGQTIYAANCASCHGDTGKGDGPAGAALDPKPSDLHGIPEGDDFIYWRINEGGAFEPFNSGMPAWKGIIGDDDIWRVVAYVRSLK